MCETVFFFDFQCFIKIRHRCQDTIKTLNFQQSTLISNVHFTSLIKTEAIININDFIMRLIIIEMRIIIRSTIFEYF